MDTIAEQDYVVIDNFLSVSLLESIHHFFDRKIAEDDFEKAAIGTGALKQRVPDIRGDYIYWLDEENDVNLTDFFLLSQEMITAFNRYCYLSLKSSEFHLAEYPIGSYYKKHLDQFDGRSNRIITFLLYLNKNWQEGDGGELRIELIDNKSLDIAPINNRCVLFKSDQLMHEVLPTQIIRRSLTGWLLHKPSVIGSLLG